MSAKAFAHPLRSQILAALEQRTAQTGTEAVPASGTSEGATVVVLLFRSPPEGKPA